VVFITACGGGGGGGSQPDLPLDTDGDGVEDSLDAFPNDPTEKQLIRMVMALVIMAMHFQTIQTNP